MDHIWRHEENGVEAKIIIKMPTDHFPTKEECLAVLSLCDRASTAFGKMMQVWDKKEN